MQLRQYFQNVSLLFVINFAIKPIWVFVIDNRFQQILSNGVYGSYFSYLSLIYVLSVVLDLGLHNYAVKTIAERKENYRPILAELWMSKLILVFIYLALVLIVILIQGLDWERGFVFFLVAVEMLCFSLYQFLRCFSQGLQLLKLDSLLSSLDRVVLILIGLGILILYSGVEISLRGYIYFHILAYSSCFIAVWLYLKSKISFRLDHFSTIQLSDIVRKGWPLIIIVILMSIYSRLDVVLLQRLLPDGDLQCGLFANSNRLIDSAFNTLALLSVFLLPTIAYQFTDKNYTYIRKIVWYSFLISSFLSISFVGLSFGLADWIYVKLFHTTNAFEVDIFRYHTWSVIGVGWMYVFGSYLTATGRFKILIAIVFVGVLVSLSLNISLIPSLKAVGVAMTASIVQMTMGILHMMAAIYYLIKVDKP